VTNGFKAIIRARLDEICGDVDDDGGGGGVFHCSAEELEALCLEVLEAEMVRTNRVLAFGRRRRRGTNKREFFFYKRKNTREKKPHSKKKNVCSIKIILEILE